MTDEQQYARWNIHRADCLDRIGLRQQQFGPGFRPTCTDQSSAWRLDPDREGPERGTASEARRPAVSVKKSITAEHLVCLEDGKKFKSLKRHLRTRYNLTPEQYREKWGLAADYPMMAPNYAAARSRLAKQMGLG